MYRETLSNFKDLAQRVSDEQLDNDTPCEDWSVRDLLEHVIHELVWVPGVLSGKTIEEVGHTHDGDLLNSDASSSIATAVDNAIAAVDAVEPRRPVHLSYGNSTARRYMRECMCDLLVHTWDLSRGIDVEAKYEPEVVDACLDEWSHRDLTMTGLFEEPVEVPEDADSLTRLIATTGRQVD